MDLKFALGAGRSNLWSNHKLGIITVTSIAITLVLDTSLVKISDLVRPQTAHLLLVPTFVGIVLVSIVGQQVLIKIIHVIRKQRHVTGFLSNLSFRIVILVYLLLAGILLFTIIQTVINSAYNTQLLFWTIAISILMATTMMSILALRLFTWHKENKNYVVFAYAFASVLLVVDSLIIFALVLFLLPDTPTQVGDRASNLIRILTGEIKDFYDYLYVPVTILTFISMWLATSMLLHHYSHKIGRVKYWILVGIPLFYFVSQFPGLFFSLFVQLVTIDPVFYGILLTLFFSFSRTVGGIFFGIAFLMIARRLESDNVVKSYLTISAYGLILLFISNQALIVWINNPYPAFGIATVSFVGLSSYLVVMGIYYSAISVSEDSALRTSIRKFAFDQSQFLDSIGVAQLENVLKKRVADVAKNQVDDLKNKSGIETSLSDDEVKKYIDVVLEEIKEQKEKMASS